MHVVSPVPAPTLFLQGALIIALTLLLCFGRHQPQEASYVLYMSGSFIRYHSHCKLKQVLWHALNTATCRLVGHGLQNMIFCGFFF